MRSPAHDIYSCGILLYELLARRVPDLGNYTKLELFDRTWAPLDPVVSRALAHVDGRYVSAAEFREALSDAAQALPG